MLEAWDEYVHSQRVKSFVPQQIASSWMRSQPRLNPFQTIQLQRLSEYYLLAAQVASFNLVSIARPVMEDTYQFLEHTSSCIVYTNSAGYILEILGKKSILEKLASWGIAKGGQFSEGIMGTNAFSLALAERFPSRVCGAEHYVRQFHVLDESAAPIFDLGGTLLGTLGIISFMTEPNMNVLAVATLGAKAIENQHQADLLLAEQEVQLAQLKIILATISEGVLVWDAEGILQQMNHSAERIMGIPARVIVGRPYKDCLEVPAFVEAALENRKPLHDIEATFQCQKKAFTILLGLQYIVHDNNLQYVIVTLKREKDIRKLALSQFGAHSLSTIDNLVGGSQKMQEIRRQVGVCANATAPVLIRGEDGTGKNLVAGAIHNAGERKNGPFVIFPCSAYPNDTILIELCGYEDRTVEGDQQRGQPGKLELANGGSLFIKDIPQLPLEAQSVLLDMLDLQIIQRIGCVRPIPVDVRVLASTTENLEQLVAQGSFQADLYYRLSTFEFNIPPLREQSEDMELLVFRILSRLGQHAGHPLKLSSEVTDIFKRYSWPGNIHQLETVLERAATSAGNSYLIQPDHLPAFISRLDFERGPFISPASIQSLDEMEHELIVRAAKLCNANQTKMASMLGISRTTLWRRLKNYNISLQDIHKA
ncbi:MAG: sigma 54-interacting transcriptional regulator [Anaerolineaceae bacterium]|nr:sigma 54-interacting transcriptional regulator [Anaerolineaceae bacterium]